MRANLSEIKQRRLGGFRLGYELQILATAAALICTGWAKDYRPADFRSRVQHADYSVSTLDARIALLPTPEEWQAHLETDLLPYWMFKAALGEPVGNFPTFRANDGTPIDPKNPPPEFLAIDDSETWIKPRVGRQYVRMAGRQIYAYCVAFHITGDEKYLSYAKAGVDYMLTHMVDENGVLYTWMEKGVGYPKDPLERISQDMTYAILGPATYYYLTHDLTVERFLIRIQKHIFDTYKIPNLGELRWVAKDCKDLGDSYTTTQRELVAQLDQINAYMLLATPTLPPPAQAAWRQDLLMLARSIREQYWSPDNHCFWGRIDELPPSPDPAVVKVQTFKVIGADHVDFGHTIKTLWMLWFIGKTFDQPDLVQFADTEIPIVLNMAFYPPLGTWIEKRKPNGELGTDRIWWIHAELDQVAATFSLAHPEKYTSYLLRTYPDWFTALVDPKGKEMWHGLTGPLPGKPMEIKAHLWKNAFHSFEHALVGYMTSSALQGRDVQLYYAFSKDPDPARVHPYLTPAVSKSWSAGSRFRSPD